MFGMESSDTETGEFTFPLEEECSDFDFKQQKLELILTRLEAIKASLKKDGSQEHFDRMGAVLQGYLAVQGIIQRIGDK